MCRFVPTIVSMLSGFATMRTVWGFFLVRVGIMTIQSVWEAASDSQYGKTESLLGRNHYKGAAGWESQPTRIKKERTVKVGGRFVEHIAWIISKMILDHPENLHVGSLNTRKSEGKALELASGQKTDLSVFDLLKFCTKSTTSGVRDKLHSYPVLP